MSEIKDIRKEFPILEEKVHGKPLVYFDNAATSQRPLFVAEVVRKYMLKINGNIHRGAHYMANMATDAFEGAREIVRNFINANETAEIIFTRGTTESINLVAYSFGDVFVREGDEIIVSEMEHHANIVPWQMLCERKGAALKVIPFDENGVLKLDELDHLLSDRTRLVAVNHVSNVLGTINPIREIIKKAHSRDVPVLIDGAQGIPHIKVDVQELDCDFYAFSGHKIYGPTGIGCLYGKRKWLEKMPPFNGGGEMIQEVTFGKTTYNELPFKFEAGTPDFVGGIALGEAIRFVERIGLDKIAAREQELLEYATQRLKAIDGFRIFGEAPEKSAVIAFQLGNIHSFDLNTFLDQMGFAIRSGRLCTDPIMDHFGVPNMLRASFACYNTEEEIDRFVEALKKLNVMLG